MHIAVMATQLQKEAWLQKPAATGAVIEFIEAENIEPLMEKAAVFFDLLMNETKPVLLKTTKPVFANAVITTLEELPVNYIRINAWNGFLNRDITEVAATGANSLIVENVMQALNWKYIPVPDVPGMIAARTISMIINEAYYALGDEVSTKEAIDIAMKLGTNYPFGPFEWGEKIGLQKIYSLLKKLNEKENRYTVAPLLIQEAAQTINQKL